MSQQFWPNSRHGSPYQPASPIGFRADSPAMVKGHPSRRVRCDFDNVIGSPFLLTTISVAVIGWAIAFFSSIAANIKDSNFSHFAWWAVMYQLCVILGVVTAVLFNAAESYQMALCAFLASALSFTTSTANALIYSSSGAQEGAAAGHIFLSIVNIIWILYFGTTSDARPHAWVDSYSLKKGPEVPGGPRPMSNANAIYPSGRYGTPYPKSVIDGNITLPAEANGLLSPTSPMTQLSPSIPGNTGTDLATSQRNRENLSPTIGEMPADMDFGYRAKALYSYDANPEDPNEISFSKGEVLEVAGESVVL